MKKIFLFLCICAATTGGFAQTANISPAEARGLVSTNRVALALSTAEAEQLAPAQAYRDVQTGVSYVYLQQQYLDVPVHNRIKVLAFKNGKLVSNAGTTVSIPAEAKSAAPGITPEAAITAAATHVKAPAPKDFGIKVLQDGKYRFGLLGIAYENITVQLYWLPINGAAKNADLKLVWQVFLAPAGTDDMWQIRVDAATGTVLEKNNLTVYEHNHADTGTSESSFFGAENASAMPATLSPASPSLVGSANYTVIAYPTESPIHGTASIASNPWLLAGAFNPNATTLNWHSDGNVDYNISRGNNVWATEDRANTNNTNTIVTPTGLPASSSTTPDPLNFIYTPDYTVAPTTAAFQQYAITNLFYWNNIIHDITYNYGFTEAAGNFQTNNLGRGGTGNDYVIALAQSASGTNNANFATPPDGSRPRMRMYLWTTSSPQRDGDLDNGVVTHEYTHGISNRLTGGIAGGGGCLSNAEQGGEGWSDYFGLMLTTNWAAAQPTDGAGRRPIGTYDLNQNPATANGIRSRPYSTNMSINNLTYSYVQTSGGQVHAIGEVWCSALWDMTWNIIQTDGINPNLFNASAAGGNSKALRLVIEGMKLQPCSPGFLDARDGILRADQILYGGQYRCAILNAFARRGMGTNARQGSSGSTSDQVVGFAIDEAKLTLTQSVTQQQEGLQVTYNNNIVAGPCAPIVNYLITDTLPANVTWISGGSYNSANRVVSFPVNLAAGANQNYAFTIQINAGSYFPTVTLFEDLVTGTTINPAIWTTSATGPGNWVVSNARSYSPPSSYFSANTAVTSDKRLSSTNAIALGATPPNLSFRHWFSTEATYDGGVLEISTDGGTNYADVGAANILRGGYTSVMSAGTPLAGRPAWTGESGGFIETIVNLAPYANQSVKFRFRSTTDDGTNQEGWYIDDIRVQRKAQVDIRSSLFNAGGIRVQVADTLTIILPISNCNTVAITTQPISTTVCAGADVTFTVAATGSLPTYVWQVSTDGGITYVPVTPAASGTSLTLLAVTGAMNGNRYRVVVSNSCPSTVTSAAAILTVQTPPAITAQPAAAVTCTGTTATFTVAATGTGITYQWQVSTAGCAGTFTNITGAQSAALSITNVTAAMNGYGYRVVISGTCVPASVTSNCVTLTVNNSTSITQQPAAASVCAGTTATFTAGATGGTISYQWQVSTNGGTTFTDIPGANSATYSIPNVSSALNGNLYRATITSNCASGLTTNAVLLTVQSVPAITAQPTDITSCTTQATFSVIAPGTGIQYQWQVSTDGGVTYTDIPGANASTYSVNIVAGQSSNRYRVRVFTASCGSLTSNAVTARGGVTPTVVLTAGSPNIAPSGNTNPGQPSGLYTTVSPQGNYIYRWTLNGTLIPNVLGPTITPANGLFTSFGVYKVTVFDVATGCFGSSNEITISDIAGERNRLFIYPNPARGTVNVSYYSSTGAPEARMLTLYDAKGSRMMTKSFSVTGNYGIMSFDMSGMQQGVYLLELRDANGKRMATEQIVKL